MKVNVKSGKYILAVSGGVDSMVLLDFLSQQPNLELVIAHFDHGIREESESDRKFVEQATQQYGYVFEYEVAHLGVSASEEKARMARYEFLNKMKEKHKAAALITAHHQDDLIETAFINLLRGTGRKGLTSLRTTEQIIRPLLATPKDEILKYARAHNIEWRDDATNHETEYLRNYVRKFVTPKLTDEQKRSFIHELHSLEQLNEVLDKELADYLRLKKLNVIDRELLLKLDHKEASEAVAAWLRLNDLRDFGKNDIEKIVVAAKTGRVHTRVTINKRKYLKITHTLLSISSV